MQSQGPVAESLECFGAAYVRRVLHADEQAVLDRSTRPAAAAGDLVRVMAESMAAKEAVMKCLDVGASDPISWTDIQVLPGSPDGTWDRLHVAPGGDAGPGMLRRVRVRLRGRVGHYARSRGIAVVLAGVSSARAEGANEGGGAFAAARAIALSGRSNPGGRGPEETTVNVGSGGSEQTAAVEARPRARRAGPPRGAFTGDGEEDRGAWPDAGMTAAGALPRTQEAPAGSSQIGGESMTSREEIIAEVREVVAQHAHLAQDAASLEESASLYGAGMTSHASVNVMLGVEDAFDIEFPEAMLTKETFESLGSIAAAVQQLGDER